ncbi:hypothetical protein BGX23_012240 [Mortierella sp. AD031]|nr:hypothetical protein BGX23_012240 [Mortierella sp. AD031]
MVTLQQATKAFGATVDENRGLVTLLLTPDRVEAFIALVGTDGRIRELNLTLGWVPTKNQLKKLRHAIRLLPSQVSRLAINFNVEGDKSSLKTIFQKGSVGQELLLLITFKSKLRPEYPFRHLSVSNVPGILRAHTFTTEEYCLAHSLALDRVSFDWQQDSKQLLDMLGLARDLSTLHLACDTLSTGYTMVEELAKKSTRLTTVEITTDNMERVVFNLNAGLIITIHAVIQASHLDTVAAWDDKIERLTVMDDNRQMYYVETGSSQTWINLMDFIRQRHQLVRLDLQCPPGAFLASFEQIQAVREEDGSVSRLETLRLYSGESELLTMDILDSAATTTMRLPSEDERKMGLLKAFTLFGFIPAEDARPSALTDDLLQKLQDRLSATNGSRRLKELNLDVSYLVNKGLKTFRRFLDQHQHVLFRLTGPWSPSLHSILEPHLSSTRLTGFHMYITLEEPRLLESTYLNQVLERIKGSISVQDSSFIFTTPQGNNINISNIRDPSSAWFQFVQVDEPFEFALTRLFGDLPSTLICRSDFTDDEVLDLHDLLVRYPDRLRSLSVAIDGLGIEGLRNLETIIQSNDPTSTGDIWSARCQFLASVAHRTNELALNDFRSPAFPTVAAWPSLRSISVAFQHHACSEGFYAWTRLMVSSTQLRFLYIKGLSLEHNQWDELLLPSINTSILEHLSILGSNLPSDRLQRIVDALPTYGSPLVQLSVGCLKPKGKRKWYGKRKRPAQIDFPALVHVRVPRCIVTIDYLQASKRKQKKSTFSCFSTSNLE